jgi:ABC-type glutathione transport system ATPase component
LIRAPERRPATGSGADAVAFRPGPWRVRPSWTRLIPPTNPGACAITPPDTDAPSTARSSTGAGEVAVRLRGIGKRFPGVIANHDIDIDVRAGTVHAIVGENGAGKSTLMKILYGVQ